MEEKEDIFKYGLKGGHHESFKEPKLKRIIKGIFNIIKKIYKPALVLILLALIFFAGYSMKKPPVQIIQKEQTKCPTCPELDCDACPKEIEKVTVVKYACTNGLIVDDLDECNVLDHVKIESPYKETDNGVTLSIDRLDYEIKESYKKITKIDYTIINVREHEIKPTILVNIYSLDDEKQERGMVHEVFDDDGYINPNAWTVKKKNVNIGFVDENMIVRLVLKDETPDPDEELVRVSRPLGI